MISPSVSHALLTSVFAAVAVLGPPLLALQAVERAGRDSAEELVLTHARDVLHRTEAAGVQIGVGFDELRAAGPDPCSDDGRAIMRRLDLASSYVQAVGALDGNMIRCSSLGTSLDRLDLGPRQVTATSLTHYRTAVRLPGIPERRFLAVERYGLVAIVHRQLPLDVSGAQKDTSLAFFNTSNREVLASRGTVDPRWLERSPSPLGRTFVSGDSLVAVVRSAEFDVSALSALPKAQLTAGRGDRLKFLMPPALILSALLLAWVRYVSRRRQHLSGELRSALRRGELHVVYQPVVDLSSGRWVGAEVLARWTRSNGDIVRPDVFIPVAEEAGLSGAVTRHVIDLVAQEARALFSIRPDFHLAINIFSADLADPSTLTRFSALTDRLETSPANVLVEASERGFVDANSSLQVREGLRKRGHQLAMDDFGTGYSSLFQLQSLHIDVLKIDKAFVDALGSQAVTSHVVDHIVQMARSLNLFMIAEGVEEEAQATRLRELGVQWGQGWLFSPGVPVAVLTRALLEQELRTT